MKPSSRTMPGTVEDRIAVFRPDMRPLLRALRELVKDGAFTTEAIVDGGFFEEVFFLDKRSTRDQKIRAMQAFVDIVTLPEGDGVK